MTDYNTMEYQARQKSIGVAFALWFFLGMFGGHRFYAGHTGVAVSQLLCTVLVVGLPVSLVWVLVDAFLLPRIIRDHNLELVKELQNRG